MDRRVNWDMLPFWDKGHMVLLCRLILCKNTHYLSSLRLNFFNNSCIASSSIVDLNNTRSRVWLTQMP